VWTDRLPQRYLDAGPHIVELEGGGQAWAYEDQVLPLDVGVVEVREGVDKPRLGARVRFDEMRPGCYDPVARLADMEIDGVWASLCFPNFTRFAGHRFLFGKDRELSLLCIKAYNDFIVDEWCAAAPGRLIPMAILPLWDVAAAVDEMDRLAPKGLKAVAFSENPVVLGLPSVHTDHWDPLWAAVEAADVPVCMHIGSSSVMLTSSPEAPSSVMFTMFGVNSMVAFADWVFSGVFDRFPGMRAVLSEGGAGWIPYMVERAEKTFGFLGTASGSQRPPAEVFREHMYACMVTDAFAMRSLDDIGVDNLMWESDYPHNDGMFPYSRKVLEDSMANVPDADAVKIGHDNAARVFRLG
jgi:predicted TIM-barrel fold metal-dependent hydrolase